MNTVLMTSLNENELKDLIRSVINENKSVEVPIIKGNENNEVLSIAELANYLKCSKTTIHIYKKRNVFPYYQTGRKVYFKKKEVDAALASQSLTNKKR